MKKTIIYEGFSEFELWEGDTLTDAKTGKTLFLCLPEEVRNTARPIKDIDMEKKWLKITIEYGEKYDH